MFGLWSEGAAEADTGSVSGVSDIFVLAKHDPEVLVLHIALVLLLCILLAALPPFKGLAFKVRCYCVGTIHFWACRENVIGNTDVTHKPATLKDQADVIEKEFIFIRHGESEWNEIFNRGKMIIPINLLLGLLRELFCLPYKHRSIFLDSPLGDTGRSQAAHLASELCKNPALSFLAEQGIDRDNKPKSVIMTSNLRRCVQTSLLGLKPRLEKSRERVYVYSCLQEAARNVDTLCLTPATENPVVDDCPFVDLLDGTYNFGSKRWYERAVKRMNIFLKFGFAREENRIIVVGHSLYFKKFFNTFLEGGPHESKRKKLSNCGVVQFKMQAGTASLVHTYRIVPESIEVLHGKWI
eukprot:TRINITY_DN13701_c0_g1_i1.p1 TRINITY_DN13701_c0_g1~~TRINITY_DN13701_c0_g1_i1.p1  ORF type:complete len:353 (+),score=43.30 TRINITY_DN13701_c0_g1_i1:33-1091(+)